MMRTQQLTIYSAENRAPRGREFADLDELEAWLHEQLLDQPWWADRFPDVRGIHVPRVDRARTEGSCGGFEADATGVRGVGTIEMARDHWYAQAVCHEVAHVTAASEGSTAHDPRFARHYLELVYRAIGTYAWLELRHRFVEAGVEFDR